MPIYSECLPGTAARGLGFLWTPDDTRPGCGKLVIQAVRQRVVYSVVEFGNDWQGRSWRLAKLTEGTDAASESEEVFIGDDEANVACSCKGFAYRKGSLLCKHAASLRAIIDNGWMPTCAAVGTPVVLTPAGEVVPY